MSKYPNFDIELEKKLNEGTLTTSEAVALKKIIGSTTPLEVLFEESE